MNVFAPYGSWPPFFLHDWTIIVPSCFRMKEERYASAFAFIQPIHHPLFGALKWMGVTGEPKLILLQAKRWNNWCYFATVLHTSFARLLVMSCLPIKSQIVQWYELLYYDFLSLCSKVKYKSKGDEMNMMVRRIDKYNDSFVLPGDSFLWIVILL